MASENSLRHQLHLAQQAVKHARTAIGELEKVRDAALARAEAAEQELEQARDTADTLAKVLDDINAACDAPNWEYPAQIVRDVRQLRRERDEALARAEAAEAVLRGQAPSYEQMVEGRRAAHERADAAELEVVKMRRFVAAVLRFEREHIATTLLRDEAHRHGIDPEAL